MKGCIINRIPSLEDIVPNTHQGSVCRIEFTNPTLPPEIQQYVSHCHRIIKKRKERRASSALSARRHYTVDITK